MRRLGLFLAGLTALAACGGEPTGPTPSAAEPAGPTPPTVLLSSIYELVCGSGWVPKTPPVMRAVFDLYLNSPPPTPESPDVQAIVNAGGRIDYLFHQSIVRAELDVDAATAFWTTKVVNAVLSVSNFSDHTISTSVVYDRPVTSADQAALAALGAQISFIFTSSIAVSIADERVPAILSLPHVTGIVDSGFGCGAAARVDAASSFARGSRR